MPAHDGDAQPAKKEMNFRTDPLGQGDPAPRPPAEGEDWFDSNLVQEVDFTELPRKVGMIYPADMASREIHVLANGSDIEASLDSTGLSIDAVDMTAGEQLAGPASHEDLYYDIQSTRFWARTDALLWWSRGSRLPALVTTSNAADSGILGGATTEIVFGDSRELQDARGGVRVQIGAWLDCRETTALEFDFFSLGEETTSYLGASDGYPILARPFTNVGDVNNPFEHSQLIGRPGPNEISGVIDIDVRSEVRSTGVRLLHNVSQWSCDTDDTCGRSYRLDLLAGYRNMRSDESLVIHEDVVLISANPVFLDVTDIFETRTDFHGGEIGAKANFNRGRWSLDVLAKVAIGNNRQEVSINGSTANVFSGVTTNYTGGLLALSTNIGQYERNRFSAIPEFGLNLGYQATDRLQFLFGYTFIYWSNIVQAGDQIDVRVNPNRIPVDDDSQPDLPAFAFNDTDFWLQGMNFGVNYRW